MNIILNNKKIEAEEGKTILDVALSNNVNIPTLCHLNLHNIKMVNEGARCRVCMVEVEGRGNLLPACATYITDGMVIKTSTPRVMKARKTNVELLLSNHPKDCLICPKNGRCELQSLASDLNVREVKYQGIRKEYEKDNSSLSIVRDKNKCILCSRCETMCNTFQTVGVYSNVNRAFDTIMTTAFDSDLTKSPCTFCGQCTSVCPTGALVEKDDTMDVLNALNDNKKYVIVETAPAVRVALGEAFGMEPGTNVQGKMISALRELGFAKVYDTNFAADLTVMEETKEFINRIKNDGPLPLLTSCCPAYINFIEWNYPDLLDIPSSCKSPHEMFGAVAKTYLAEKLEIDPKNMIVVSVMPCVAKKHEAARSELKNEKLKNVDYVISTRELSRMIKEAGIDFDDLEDSSYDELMGETSGGGIIFGVTGGVIEAVMRNASYIIDKKNRKIEFKELRGMKGIREASVVIGDKEYHLAIAHGLGNARKLLDDIKNKKSKYHAIEIMACPSGCIGGGGQPYYLNNSEEILSKRAKAIYNYDKEVSKKASIENTEIRKLYKEFLGEVGGEKAHALLHTSFRERKIK